MTLPRAARLLAFRLVTAIIFFCFCLLALPAYSLSAEEEACTKAVDGWRLKGGDNQAFIAAALEKLAAFYAKNGQLDKAEEKYREALTERQKSSEPQESFIALTKIDLALCLDSKADSEEACALLQQALFSQSALLGADSRALELTKTRLAKCLRNNRKYDQAEVIFQDLLKQARLRSRTFLRQVPVLDDLIFAAELSDVIDIKMRAKKWREAIPLCEELLVLYQIEPIPSKNLPLGYPKTQFDTKSLASAQLTMAICYSQDHQYQQADRLFQRSLAVFQHSNDCPLSYIAVIKSCQADSFVLQGRDKEAENLYKQALQLWKKVNMPNDFDECNTIKSYLALQTRVNSVSRHTELVDRLSQCKPRGLSRLPLPRRSVQIGTIEFGS